MKTVLIIDSDLGFVLWLGRALYDGGYDAFPATDIPEATALISELPNLDLLVVNPSLAGATDFVDSLRRARAGLKVIALLDEKEQEASQMPNADASVQKSPEADEAATARWRGMVGQLFFRDCAA